jgi:hypothetical protein
MHRYNNNKNNNVLSLKRVFVSCVKILDVEQRAVSKLYFKPEKTQRFTIVFTKPTTGAHPEPNNLVVALEPSS